MIVNHWGKWVDSEQPVTGVLSNHNIEWLFDEVCYEGSIDLGYEDYIAAYEGDIDSEDYQKYLDAWESDPSNTILIGQWIKEGDQYVPDPKGEFSAIVREDVTQVVLSTWVMRGALCSPCYPGQVDLDSDGDFVAYILPPEILGGNWNNSPIKRIEK